MKLNNEIDSRKHMVDQSVDEAVRGQQDRIHRIRLNESILPEEKSLNRYLYICI